MNDPRVENCRRFAVNAEGKVTGVELVYEAYLDARYELLRAELIDEPSAAGNTVAKFVVLDKDGIETAERVWLAWPYPGMQDGKTLPGNPNNEHMVSGLPYNPPETGPGGMYVGDANGQPISDIIGGLGLPYNRHVCYRLTWKERSATAPTDPTPGEIGGALYDVLCEIRDLIKQGFRL